jgi:Phage integrase family
VRAHPTTSPLSLTMAAMHHCPTALRTIGLSGLDDYALRSQRGTQGEQRLRPSQRSSNPDECVFTTEQGSPVGFRRVWHAFRLATDRARVWRIRFHYLRHACSTVLLTGGEELAVIRKVLGHSDSGTTMEVYAHMDPKRAKAAANRFRRHARADAAGPRGRRHLTRNVCRTVCKASGGNPPEASCTKWRGA